jgi:tetratricopeptide (TPR) repeat protein
MQFKGTKTPLPEIARKLGVKGIVEGSVQRQGDRVRVTVQLIDAERDRHIWSRNYDRDLRDVLMLQNEIARAIADELQATLEPQERRRLTATRTVNPEAYRSYARGRRLCDLWTVDGFNQSFQLFEAAVSLEPAFAEAHGAYAECLLYLVTWGAERPRLVWPRIREHAQKAIEIRPDDPTALAVLGMVRLQGDWDWAGAGSHLDRVVELAPSNSFGRGMRSVYLTAMGRIGEALNDAWRTDALDPGSTLAASFLPWVNAHARRFDEAAQGWNRLLGMDPHAYFAKSQIVFALTRLGKSSEAVQFYNELRSGMPAGTDQLVDGWVMEYEVARGMKVDAARVTELWTSRRANAYADAYHLAWMNSVLGQRDEAMKWLEIAYAERSAEMYLVKVDPTLDALRGDPRFEAIIERMRFPK